MSKREHDRHLSRRELLLLGGGGVLAAIAVFLSRLAERFQVQARSEASDWPTDQEGILRKIESLAFTPGSELRTNFMPRKTMWEEVQLLKMRGEWAGGSDESDWQAHPEIIASALDMLVEAGIKGARLVVVPFEITEDGETYHWEHLETVLNMFANRDLIASLSVGPVNYPFGPNGARLPSQLAQRLAEEMQANGKNHLALSLEPDPSLPDSSVAIRDFSLDFLRRLMERYAHDARIDKFYLGNEWPDTNSIEGVAGTLQVDRDLMEEAISILLTATDKKIALNTNIPPSDFGRLQRELGPLLELLGERGVLGLDPYPTQEAGNPRIAERYGEDVQRIRQAYPATEIVFTEYQAEVWPPRGIEGKPWAEIQRDHPELVEKFFQESFPQNLERYMIASGITEVGLYGSPQWPIAAQMGYDFPIRMLKRISEVMAQARR